MVDVLSFAAPFGALGWVAERLFVAAHLRRLIVQRGMVLKELAEWGLIPRSGRAPGNAISDDDR
jgi:hypothetical protein